MVMPWEKIDDCTQFAFSLINNISMSRGLIYVPDKHTLSTVCTILRDMARAGFDFRDNMAVLRLIQRPSQDRLIQRLFAEINRLPVYTREQQVAQEQQQRGGSRTIRRPVATDLGLLSILTFRRRG
jgi:hypothetical protein